MVEGKIKAVDNMTYERACQVWNYNPDTGEIRWGSRPENDFKSQNRWLKYCESKEGVLVGTKTKKGYLVVSFMGVQYYLHRIAWLLSYKIWPENYIDHINRNKSDNRLSNLREVTSGENSRNSSLSSRNSSGQIGVSFCETNQVWRARWSSSDGSRGYAGRSVIKYGFEKAKEIVTEIYKNQIAELEYSSGHGGEQPTSEFASINKKDSKILYIGRVMSHGKLYWRVQYFKDGWKSRMFSVEKYGEDQARKLAQDVYDALS